MTPPVWNDCYESVEGGQSPMYDAALRNTIPEAEALPTSLQSANKESEMRIEVVETTTGSVEVQDLAVGTVFLLSGKAVVRINGAHATSYLFLKDLRTSWTGSAFSIPRKDIIGTLKVTD